MTFQRKITLKYLTAVAESTECRAVTVQGTYQFNGGCITKVTLSVVFVRGSRGSQLGGKKKFFSVLLQNILILTRQTEGGGWKLSVRDEKFLASFLMHLVAGGDMWWKWAVTFL